MSEIVLIIPPDKELLRQIAYGKFKFEIVK